ncbi:MAG: DNA topoisomerase, partial [Nitrososphaerota archaeon]
LEIHKQTVKHPPPTPFNIGDLQREAYRVFGFSPSQTLTMAERLYLDALISYPRTSSQKLPASIDYRKILAGLSQIQSYTEYAQELLSGRLIPHEGDKEDPAHPAIYPTGEAPKRALEAREAKLYDLIVKRFFAVFGDPALRERVSAIIAVGRHRFKLSGRRTIQEGWLRYYRDYSAAEDQPIPPLKEGDVLRVKRVEVSEKYEQPPPRYNQSSLLQKMEAEGIGTKTTRAEVISTLYERGYITGESIMTTDIGFSIVETMRRYSSLIISTEMTKGVERDLEAIERGDVEASEVVERTIEGLLGPLYSIRTVEVEIGREI